MNWLRRRSWLVVIQLVLGLAVAGWGGVMYAQTTAHDPDRIPAGGIEIQIGPRDFLNVSNTLFSASVVENSIMVQIEFEFAEIRTYYFYAIVPFVVRSRQAPFVMKYHDSHMHEPGSNIGDIRSDFQKFPHLGSSILNASFTPNATDFTGWPLHVTLSTKVYVERLVAKSDRTTGTVILTFYGDVTQIIDSDMYKSMGPDSFRPTNRPFAVRVEFPTEAFLSSDTYPAPIEYFVTSISRAALFSLDFSCPTYECAQTVSCSFVYPARTGDVQTEIFWSGVMVGVGVPLSIEAVKDALSKKRRDDKHDEVWISTEP